MSRGDLILWIMIIGAFAAFIATLWAGIRDGLTETAPTPQTSELVTDEDEADPIHPFRRIGPVAADVVADLDRRRR